MTRRVNVDFSDQAYTVLSDIAKDTGKTRSAVLRDSLALERWFREATSNGSKVLLEDEEGNMREILPR